MTTKETTSKNVKPCAVILRSKGIQGKVFANPVKGSSVPLYKATFERRYVNKNKEFKSVHSYAEDEVLILAATALTTWSQMCELRKTAWATSNAENDGDDDADAESAVDEGDEE